MNRILKAAIIANYGTQKAFAERHGLTELQLSQLIYGRRKMRPKTKAWLCRVLNTPAKLLFKEEVKHEQPD